jgi:hypothetical protein
MNKSTISLARQIEVLEIRRRVLLKKLTNGEPVVIGNVYDVMRRCGNPSCHCAAKPGHPQTLLIYVEDGRRRCKFVRKDDAAQIKDAWKRYRECKTALREFRALQMRELQVLRAQIEARRLSYE